MSPAGWRVRMSVQTPDLKVSEPVTVGPFSVRAVGDARLEITGDVEADTREEAAELADTARKCLELTVSAQLVPAGYTVDPLDAQGGGAIVVQPQPAYLRAHEVITADDAKEAEEAWMALVVRSQRPRLGPREQLAILAFEQAATTAGAMAGVHLYRCVEHLSFCYGTKDNRWNRLYEALNISEQDLSEVWKARNQMDTAHAARKVRRLKFNRLVAFAQVKAVLLKRLGVHREH